MFSRLAPQLISLFDSAVRSRGESYYREGAVQVRSGSSDRMEAFVRGSQDYQVELDWDGEKLGIYCSCPHYDSDGKCKHIWASVLAADARGYLTSAKVGGAAIPQFSLFETREQSPVRPAPPRMKAWKARIEEVGAAVERGPARREWPAKREILYVVEPSASVAAGHVVLSLFTRDRKLNGGYSRENVLRIPRSDIAGLPLAEDREVLSAIAGAGEHSGGFSTLYGQLASTNTLRHPLSRAVISLAAKTGRCFFPVNGAELPIPLVWDEGEAWRFELRVSAGPERRHGPTWRLSGVLRRGESEEMDAVVPLLVTPGGLVFTRGKVALLAEDVAFEWLLQIRRSGAIDAPDEDRDEMLATLLSTPSTPRLTVPEELRFEEVAPAALPCLRVLPGNARYGKDKLEAELLFDYEGRLIPSGDKSPGFYDARERKYVRRNADEEKAALTLLQEAGVRARAASYYQPDPGWEIAPAKLPRAIAVLMKAGWRLEVDGKVFRRPGAFNISVSSGLDWFELYGDVEYGETFARMPELLEALRRGENTVKLQDGSYGVLPEEMVRRVSMLAGMGTAAEGHIRFRKSQAGLLDALLAAQPEATFDAGFARMREELKRFRSVEAAEQPAGFVGQLRDYQREGLGWMDFLRRFSFGGCLADDMGVGKTAQVLAMLESRRQRATRPSLVVVPRSLLFNWKREAERFTPELRVLDYAGLKREAHDVSAFDLVLVTYGTLRRDAARLKDVEFDYVVLDEAQAIKNANTESARAVRLLKAEHRLALSGTPVENHIGELWSLFEFLNPGMLGAASVFKAGTSAGRSVDEETRKLLSSALRPFILRRTKDQVAKELPAKTEQTIYCELDAPQRKLYDELRAHYRDSLLKRIESEGLAKSKIMVLEALLRLRQAACHPGLIDGKRAGEPSAKLESLLEQLREVLDSGHKALVFSQFTKLLAIVRDRLDKEGVVYEYLDGKTKDREARVERFQNDVDCKLFLVSLKAGGLGLNLTAADYVFLLDPWWNPAVEAQAVDRAHRIGQVRSVFAYRLIARDTVEEKVLELQKSKRDLAAAIIGEDNALIRDLRPEDLELLLS
jgi:superfamily II DNA or RNA helicase